MVTRFRILTEKIKENVDEMSVWLKEEYEASSYEIIEKMADVGEEKVPNELSELRIKNGCTGCPKNVETEVLPALVAETCGKLIDLEYNNVDR